MDLNIQKAIQVHNNKYNYSKTIYQKMIDKVIIICQIHGEFIQTLHKHLQGDGCKQCGIIARAEKKKNKARQEFIDKANIIHSNKYIYEKTIYTKAIEPVIITCKIHGDFETTPNKHLNGQECLVCSKEKFCENLRYPLDKFLSEVNQIYNNKYDYSKINWIGIDKKIEVYCPEHNESFKVLARSHKSGIACKKCKKDFPHKNKYTTEKFISKAISIWNDRYDYSETIYNGAYNYVKIKCNIHGNFEQLPNNHYRYGCSKCAYENNDNHRNKILNKKCKNDFIYKANEIFNNKYDYSKVDYINAVSKVIIICSIHGEFLCSPNNHLNGKGCNLCGKESCKQILTKDVSYLDEIKEINKDIYDYSEIDWKGSTIPIRVKCNKHGYFHILPYYHVKGKGCIKCNNQYSRVSLEWIRYCQVDNKFFITHSENKGEYIIENSRYKVDGYCEETKCVYEFHGDFWHGNPQIFNENDINPVTLDTFGTLYKNTITKKEFIINRGYKYISIWETQWNLCKKIIKQIQRKFREKRNK